MFLAHAPFSYLGNELIQKKEIRGLKHEEQILVAFFSLFFGILPDFDIFLLTFLHIPTFLHHEIISHTPILYFGIWILLRLLVKPFSKILNKKTAGILHPDLLNILANTFLISTLLHLFADILTSEILLLYPLSDTKFTVFKYLLEPNLFAGYSLSPLFAIEIVVIAIFCLYVLERYLSKNKCFSFLTKLFLSFSCIYFFISIFIDLNTYNSAYLYDENGKTSYDLDYDSIIDSADSEVGRDGIENILNTSSTEIFDSAVSIINSQKWSGRKDGNLEEKTKYLFGGFDSFRLISQAYYNLHLPIEPVLSAYYFNKNNIEEYDVSIPYSETLLSYFKEKDLLLEMNLNVIPNIPRGRIIFFVGEEEKILNIGITLESNYIASVLESDSSLKMHSYSELREAYSNTKKIYILK